MTRTRGAPTFAVLALGLVAGMLVLRLLAGSDSAVEAMWPELARSEGRGEVSASGDPVVLPTDSLSPARSALSEQDRTPGTSARLGAESHVSVANIGLDEGGRIEGRIAALDGAPVEQGQVLLQGTQVKLARFGEDDWTRAVVKHDGSFAFEGVPAGSYRLFATGRGLGWYGRGRKVVVGVGEVRDVGVLRVAAARSIRGRVLDRWGSPIAFASVEIREARGEPVEAHARTDRAGEFVLDHLSNDSLDLWAWAPKYWEATVALGPVDSAPGDGLEIVLEDAPRVRGLVVDRRTGKPIEHFAWNLDRLGDIAPGHGTGPEPEQAEGDPDLPPGLSGEMGLMKPRAQEGGIVETAVVRAGRYRIRVVSREYVLGASRVFEVHGTDQPLADLVIELEPGHTLAGSLVAGTQVVMGARIELWSDPSEGERLVAAGRCSHGGSFYLTGIPRGRFFLKARARYWATSESDLFSVTGDRDDLVVRMRLPARVFGRVIGMPKGVVVSASVAAVMPFSRRVIVPVGRDGFYEIKGLDPGAYHFQAFTGEPGPVVSRLLTEEHGTTLLVEEQELQLDLTCLTPDLAILKGDVFGPDGAAEGFTVAFNPLNRARSHMQHLATVGGNGGFRMEGLRENVGRVSVYGPGARLLLHEQDVALRIGGETKVRIDLETGGLEVRFAAEDGKTLEGYAGVVRMGRSLLWYPGRPETDPRNGSRIEAGVLLVPHLPSGPVTLRVQPEQGAIWTFEAEIVTGTLTQMVVTPGVKRSQ